MLVLSCEETNISTKKVEVCLHYNCADATIIQVTDQYFPKDHDFVKNDSRKHGALWAEFLAFKYNIPLHVFERDVKGKEFVEFLRTGRGGASVYYPSCNLEYRKSKLDSIKSEIESVYCKSISTLSYGCGKTDYADSLPDYILGGRTSGYGFMKSNSETNIDYGSEFETLTYIKRPSAGRYYTEIQSNGVTIAEAALYVEKQVEKTIRTKGFYTNFMHWHDYYKNRNDSLIEGVTVMEPLFKAMNTGLKNGTNSGLDYNEAVEYLYTKELVGKIEIEKDEKNEFHLRIKHTLKKAFNYQYIDTPLSIKIPYTSVSKFSFLDIDAVENVFDYRIYSNYIILNVLLDFKSNETSIVLTKNKNANKIYNVTERPSVIVKSWFTNEIRFANKSKLVLFRRKKEAKEYEIEIVDRRQIFSEKYKLPKLEEGYDYFCGAIDENRKSTLIEL